ncbi:MAG: VWA domain-containing protein [Candidatus Nanopelagicales bacterium]|nr:VWA domain-containing protein [Candidatus Nanopelagicales bacterium]
MTSSQAPELTGFDELFIEFAQDLRFHGLVVGSDDVITYLSAISVLNASDIMDVYWSGRIALVRKKENIPLYNKRFQAFFLDIGENEPDARKVKLKSSANAGATLEVPNVEQGLPGEVIEDETRLGYMASAADISRHKAFADCSDEEINRFRKLISMLKVSPPKRRTYRTQTTPKGKVLDMRRMARETMRSLGEPKDLMYIKRKEKLRSIVFILDVSGSMADYSRNLLQLAYSARRANTKVEVFCFGTRLTRITKSIDKRTPDEAMRLAGESVLDWDGGTRIGDAIAAFVKESRRSRLGRGAIVVICSDGLDQGEPQALDKAMQTLSRLAHKVIWVNPHKGDNEDYKPNTIGMMIADPYIDRIFSGHNFKSIEEFARELSRMG